MKKSIAIILWLILVPQFVYEMANGSLTDPEIAADFVKIISYFNLSHLFLPITSVYIFHL